MKRFIAFLMTLLTLILFAPNQNPLLASGSKKNVNFSSPPNYTLKVDYSPLFPGIQAITLGRLPAYGEVLGVWRHTVSRSIFYLYRVKGKKIERLGPPCPLPPESPPAFTLLNGLIWIACGPRKIDGMVLHDGSWSVERSFSTGEKIGGLKGLRGMLLVAREEKPGRFRFSLFSRGGRMAWEDARSWHGRAFGFAELGGKLWISVDDWDGISSTLLEYGVKGAKIASAMRFITSYRTSAFQNGKIILSGRAFLNGRQAAVGTVWLLSRYGMKRLEAFFLESGSRLRRSGDVIPFESEKLAASLVGNGGTDLLIQYEPNKEVIEPMAVCVFHMGRTYHDEKETPHFENPAPALAFFLEKRTRVKSSSPAKKFNPLKYKHLLLPWQWKEWREHVARTGHEGISGISGAGYPYAHSWKAISDRDPRHTVWACDAMAEDYLAGRVKGTRWPYIPFDQDLREPICERCHPIRTAKPSIWSMYNVKMKGNQLTPDGMRAPEQ